MLAAVLNGRAIKEELEVVSRVSYTKRDHVQHVWKARRFVLCMVLDYDQMSLLSFGKVNIKT